eukprot:CAMPEP_0197074012 /NCGR_PEP_ID=MMETSP1384-20130603/210893_1 /TAXON_ID=29189 /ORGANISM="Ammonia sp." /LENGTH=569 /DNA_ID=CAMNT_0042512853 /DNA_START=88 /DNA_END=1799 /DNA_ORIENTATION=-
MNSIAVIFAVYYHFLSFSQALTCTQSCYDITLTTSPEFDADLKAYCYTYSVSLSDDASCNADTASTKILFGIDPAQCSPTRNDLASKIVATDPFNHAIYDDPANIKGIEFGISTGTITICIKGTDGNTMIGPLVLEDASNQCLLQTYADLPDICGICDGDEADSTCFCQSTLTECATANRPRGDLVCSWDSDNSNECIAITPPECELDVLEDASNQCLLQTYADLPDICGICDGDEADSTCFCQSTLTECETANRPRGDLVCSWDSDNSNECIAITPPECELDVLIKPCECFWSQNECEGIAAEGPRDCDWDDLREMCLPIDCIGDDLECRCLSFQPDCESDEIVDFPPHCVWTLDQNCTEVTTTEQPSTTEEVEGIAAEGPRDCDWDDLREMCLPIDCIGDDLECRCLSFQPDCESDEIVDFPPHCVWTLDQNCTEVTTTEQPSTTEEVSTTEEISTTQCVDHCGCFKTMVECNGDIEELRCVWVDECVEVGTTTTDMPEISVTPTDDGWTTTRRTRPPRTTTTSTSTTWSKTSTTWSKPTKSKDCDKDKDKEKGDGKKGGKKGSGGN